MNNIAQTEAEYKYPPAYVAGLMDADGCISIVRSRATKGTKLYRHTLHVVITGYRADDFYNWLTVTFGGTAHASRLDGPVVRGKQHRVAPHWRIHGYVAKGFLEWILPCLHMKRAEAELALEHISTLIPPGRGLKPFTTSHTVLHRERLRKQMKRLKAERYETDTVYEDVSEPEDLQMVLI